MEMKTGSFAAIIATTLLWGFVWALPGGVIEAIDNVAPSAHGFTRQIDMWPQTLGIPGLVGGVLFSLLLRVTGGRRRLAELSPSRTAAWGAVSGLAVAVLVVWVMDTGLSDPWQLAVGLAAIATLMGAVTGAVSPLVFRFVTQRRAAMAS